MELTHTRTIPTKYSPMHFNRKHTYSNTQSRARGPGGQNLNTVKVYKSRSKMHVAFNVKDAHCQLQCVDCGLHCLEYIILFLIIGSASTPDFGHKDPPRRELVGDYVLVFQS